MTKQDALLDVFLSTAKKDVFHSVEHRGQIWREDPFDVDSVHEEARTAFQRLLTQVTTPPGLDAGRILLLLGESGSGKTHLVRAFRNHVHLNGLGFVGYMQMTTSVTSYSRYLVSNLVDSLDQTYYEALGTGSGLLRLSNAVAARCGDPETIRSLNEREDLDEDEVVDLVERAADRLIRHPRYADLDLDLIRALLYLQRQDPARKKRVVKYLRCDVLSEREQKLLGGLSPKREDEDAQRVVEELGRLMWACDSRALVLCVDQFEDAYRVNDAESLFRRVMSSLCAVADQVPSSIIVIACLKDYYETMRARLTRSTLDRVERDPAPVHLVAERRKEEIIPIIQKRLAYLYETAGHAPADGAANSLYPIPRGFVEQLSGMSVRAALNECQILRDACIDAGRIVAQWGTSAPPSVRPRAPADQDVRAAKEKIEQEWNDFLAQFEDDPSEDETEIAALFAWAVNHCAEEIESGIHFDARPHDEAIEIDVRVPIPGGATRVVEEILVVVCNRAPQGGGLRAQFEDARKRAGRRTLALLRCGEFPRNPNTQVHSVLAEILKNGGRKAVFEESDQRTLAAFHRFHETHARREHFSDWLREENHISRLLPLIHVLDLDRLDRFEQELPPSAPAPRSRGAAPSPFDTSPASPGAPPRAAEPDGATPGSANGAAQREALSLALGTTGELVSHKLMLDAEQLTAHAAFLGSTGSGKTTLALNLIEQLLLHGVPAILIDRKGDLCGYARQTLFTRAHPEAALDARQRALAERLDVALFTPGHPGGRQLGLSLMPSGIEGLPDLERDQAAGYAAHALGDMLGYKQTRKDKGLRTILVQAFQLFAAHGASRKLDVASLIELIANEDPALVATLGRLDTRLFKDLVHDLEVLKLNTSDLLSMDGEALDVELLLGLGRHSQPGKTRLSIVSTKFLGDSARVLFWVAQLLLALSRWVSRAPSPHLRAVVLLDEADMYLPAQSQPATKAPMENLLRRARSGGLGVLLATQSPGDLDYRCRDNLRSWFVGRVTQQTALDKMKPLLSDARMDVSARIPGQEAGEFHLLQDGRVTAFKRDVPLLRAEQVPESEILKLARRRPRDAAR
ncbi:helicase HerA-like domain-containing protein [Sorangium sp. So ce281]|uniref:helicase HerA-like domain-containing protein n=1 Tax=unclassified Sorangium TaxID=2621164 RepID=UPI003F63E53E